MLMKIEYICAMHSNFSRTRNDTVRLTFCITNTPKHSSNGSYALVTTS